MITQKQKSAQQSASIQKRCL